MPVRLNFVLLVMTGVLCLLAIPFACVAEIRLPRIFSDGMVLQRDQPVPVWGWAEAGAQVTLEFAGQIKTVRADARGKWEIKLDPMPASAEPRSIILKSSIGNLKTAITNILVGDVFQCSGQSNAAMGMDGCKRYPGTLEDINGTTLPDVRIFQVPWGQFRDKPQDDVPASCAWDSLRPEKNAAYSAMAFYFARSLHLHLKIPVGIVRASHAGGMAEIKMPKEALLSYEGGRKFYDEAMKFFEKNKDNPQLTGREKPGKDGLPPEPQPDGTVNGRYPASDWNGAIAPVIGYGKRGILWYQGEHNAGSGSFKYRETLPALIRSWREASGNPDLPFIIVQLPTYEAKGWPMLRESQLAAYRHTNNAGFVVMIDHGEKDNIHPADKRFVGERLALEARRLVYGENVTGCGPLYEGCSAEGDKMLVRFSNIGSGLCSPAGKNPAGFTICGANREFIPADAEIVGDKVVVRSSKVQKPLAVRYAWESVPASVSLFSKEGLPASPFRTDEGAE